MTNSTEDKVFDLMMSQSRETEFEGSNESEEEESEDFGTESESGDSHDEEFGFETEEEDEEVGDESLWVRVEAHAGRDCLE